MSKIYNLTKQIHTQLDRLTQEIGKKVEIKSEYYIYTDGRDFLSVSENSGEIQYLEPPYYPVLQSSQIRQTLIVFEPELGRNPDKLKNGWKETNEDDYNEEGNGVWSNQMQAYLVGVDHGHDLLVPETKSAQLCQRWLDGLRQMFKTNQVQVLTEFLETLKSIKKP